MDQRDAFGETGCCQPGCLPVRLDFGSFDSDQVVKGIGSVDEPVVAVGEACPEPCGEFLAEVDQGRAVMSAKAPVLLLCSNDIGGAGQIELFLGRVDVLTAPEFVADADVVVDGCPDLGGKCRAGARDDAAAAGPAKDVVIRDGGTIRRAAVGLKVRECADQALSSLTAEDAEDIDAGQAGFQPA
ncbi:hypothetical protein AB0M23_21695 [Streptomyces sp. NPDC052077]|uniref:hypothetical protein n=1 Tax=Streptomyces sp. NPDC052077 TaxID=3154757 RepID=UPI0034322CAD